METQGHPDTKCLICEDVITNPICPDCLGNEFKAWLGDHRRTVLLKIQKDLYSFKEQMGPEGTTCVICKEPMAICPHCLAKSAQRIIDGEDEVELSTQFMTHFNWNLWQPPIRV